MSNLFQTYKNHVQDIIQNGHLVKPKNKLSHIEVIGKSFEYSTDDAILMVSGRKLSYSFMFSEAYNILKGNNRVQQYAIHAPSIENFSDDGYILRGNYGPPFVDQISWAAETMAKDPTTRQCIINLWRNNPGSSKDIPCTLSLQFLNRNGDMTLIVSMRSSDAYLGIPYDVYTFACMLEYFTTVVRLWNEYEFDLFFPTNKVIINIGSAHIYERDIPKIKKLDFDFESVSDILPHFYEFQPDEIGNNPTDYLRELSLLDRKLQEKLTGIIDV